MFKLAGRRPAMKRTQCLAMRNNIELCCTPSIALDMPNHLHAAFAGRRPAIKYTLLSSLHTKQRAKKYESISHQCIIATRRQTWYAQETMVEEVWSRRGSRGEIGYPEIIWFGQVCTSLAQHLSREVLKILRVGLFQPDSRGISVGRGQAARSLFLWVHHRN